MRPSLHPRLVNGRWGDPALFVEALFRRRALLFDLGDLRSLSPRDLLRIDHVFVSHMHVDHFIGFDALLRVNIGREAVIRMAGPPGFTDRLHHRLQGYEWDLAERYAAELVFEATEMVSDAHLRRTRFAFRSRFRAEPMGEEEARDGLVASGEDFAVRARLLEHHGPCLGFAVAEPAHVNVWRTRLEARGLPKGAWLSGLKQAVAAGRPDDWPVALPDGGTAPLGTLRDLVTIGPGQKIAYVTDVVDTPANRAAIAALAEDADTLFIESRFRAADADEAKARAHLTTRAAGEIARRAGVRRVEPFHFSPRYEGQESEMLAEVEAAFSGG